MGVISGSCSEEQAKDKEREREETDSNKRGKREKKKAVRAGVKTGSSVSEHKAKRSTMKKQKQHQQNMMSGIRGATRRGQITD